MKNKRPVPGLSTTRRAADCLLGTPNPNYDTASWNNVHPAFLPQNEVEVSTNIPQNILDSIRIALGPYMNREGWETVRGAILSPNQYNHDLPREREDQLLCTEELAGKLHVSRVTIFRYMKAGKIRAYKFGRRNLFSLNEVMATLKGEEATYV